MSLASILRSLGGRETPPPIPRKRRFDAEMPDLPDDMTAEQDYDPQDLDPTQGIGRSEDLYQDKGPQKMTPISEDIPENGPPPFGPDKPPSRFRQAAMAAIPAMIRGGIVAASSPTRGQIGTAGDIFGSMRAVMDDRQQQDILAHNMRRQAARDAQDAEYSAARTEEQKARAQMERTRADAMLKGKSPDEVALQARIKQLEAIKGSPLTWREIATLPEAGRIYGSIYDPRTVGQAELRDGIDPEEIRRRDLQAKQDAAAAKVPTTMQGVAAKWTVEDKKKAEADLKAAQESGDEDAIAAAANKLGEIRKTVTDSLTKKPSFPPRPSTYNAAEGTFSLELDPDSGKWVRKRATAKTDEGEVSLSPFVRPRAPKSESPTASRKSSVESGLNKVLRETFAALGSQGGTELQRLQVAKENIGKFYQNDPAVAPFAAEISSRIDQLIKSGGAATTTVDKNVKTEEQKKNQNDPERAQARKELLTENKGARIPSSAEITARVEQNRKKKQGGSNNVLPPEAVSKLKEGEVTTFRNGQRWTLKNGQPAQVN